MCGINLAFGKETVEVMNEILRHRGIRSTNTHLTSDLHLGHVRLPIQGLGTEHDHPQHYKGLIGAFVGEIFNYETLSIKKDPPESDLPLLLEFFRRFENRAFYSFDGFWSSIIYDERINVVHVHTDPLAKKPLYMRMKPFAISSEIKTLLPLGANDPDEIYFSGVAKWGYCPDRRTPFHSIGKIPPGTHLVINPKNGEILGQYEYWSLSPVLGMNTGNIVHWLDEAVKNRTVSDVPISLLMSGGLDSTIIYYLLRQHVEDLTIFHVENDEAKYLEYIDFRPTDKLIKIDIDKNDYDLDQIIWANDGPVDLGSMVPQYLLAREIKKHGFNVCLSGDGADELFGGYKRSREYDSQYSDIFHELVNYHLPRLDKMMSAHTVELRCPFLSWPLISIAMGLPYETRIDKLILKSAFTDMIPKEIIQRKKEPLRYRPHHFNRHTLIQKYRELVKERALTI